MEMSPGAGSIFIWYNLIPPGQKAFNAWHSREHMISRLELKGFLRARRYAAVDPLAGYLCWYELSNKNILDESHYQSLLTQQPSAEEQAVERYFTGIARSVCDLTWWTGSGIGGSASVYQCKIQDEASAANLDRLRFALETLVRDGHLASVKIYDVVSHNDLQHKREDRRPNKVIVIESSGEMADLYALCADSYEPLVALIKDNAAVTADTYRLQTLIHSLSALTL